MTHAEVEGLQRDLNRFTTGLLKYVTPLRVDGDYGQASKKRVRLVKYYLGYPVKKRTSVPDRKFRRRLAHPHGIQFSTPWQQAVGARRRREQRKHAKKTVAAAQNLNGVGTFDGKPVAGWLVPHLRWARDHGWHGTLVSGYRTPAYSQHLCYGLCGRPSCSGTCAGTSSNHTKLGVGNGAVDVSDYLTFARVIRNSPHRPAIRNDLPRDLVHFSASGR